MKHVMSEGDRVRHNYPNGHGNGTVVGVRDRPDGRLNIDVLWDSGAGPMPYSCNDETQEIVALRGRERKTHA